MTVIDWLSWAFTFHTTQNRPIYLISETLFPANLSAQLTNTNKTVRTRQMCASRTLSFVSSRPIMCIRILYYGNSARLQRPTKWGTTARRRSSLPSRDSERVGGGGGRDWDLQRGAVADDRSIPSWYIQVGRGLQKPGRTSSSSSSQATCSVRLSVRPPVPSSSSSSSFVR